MSIVYAQERNLSVEDYVAVLSETTMRSKRPLANAERIGRMLRGANFIVTAREDGVILGLARCISDNEWIAYCAELAVKESAQGRGIGKGIIGKCYELLGPGMGLILAAEPEAVAFYERVGMQRLEAGFFHPRTDAS
ncbi:MAG: GNAT family N-acetyltransferase [Devosia sp.]